MGHKDKESKRVSKQGDKNKSSREHKSKRRHHDKSEKESGPSKRRRNNEEHVHIVDEDPDDDDMWIESNIDMDGEEPLATDIPTADSLKLTSHAYSEPIDPSPPPPKRTEIKPKRDEWMLMPPSVPTVPEAAPRLGMEDESLTEDYGELGQNARTGGGTVDFFTSLGTEHTRKKPEPDRPDPDKLKVHDKELNITLKQGGSLDDIPSPARKANVPGGPGSQWRMMKLKRVYELAEEEDKPVGEVALERFESLEAFEEAKEERRILDERDGRRASRAAEWKGKGRDTPGERGFMFNDVTSSGTPSRSSSFRRPGIGNSVPSTPTPGGADAAKKYNNPRLNILGTPGQTHTPIPSVMTPSASMLGLKRAMSPSSLNRLQAKVLRAKLMGGADTEALEKQYEEELRKAQGAEDGVRTTVHVLPTLDARGRMYDVGAGKDDPPPLPGNRRKKEYVETRDSKTGELLRINADDDQVTLGDMLREEKFGAGMADQKNLDAEFARTIMTDGTFKDDVDYMDENADRLARKKMRSDAMKRQFAINDYKRTQKVLATCPHCFGEDDSPPKVPFVAMGTRAYLSCTQQEELTPGHCVIVPIQHHLNMLEADDDVWDEVRNFMKSLMRMYAEEDKGVVFYETVISLKPQKHAYIECVPVPWDIFDQLPGYFKESILMSETEWSQHKKLIDFAARPGGFRRAMVPNLPYFMVQFDYKGEKGYGHVIEGTSEATGAGAEDPEGDIDEGEKGGGEFPRYFAGEIIGNLLDIEPRHWRHPRRIDFRQNRERVREFKQKYDKYDWTGMIGK